MKSKNNEELVAEILNDPAASHWLKKAISELGDRDPIDAAGDAYRLSIVMQARRNDAISRAKREAVLRDEKSA